MSNPSSSAIRHPGFRWFFLGNALAMMADNIEHVISYWVIFDKFQSPSLAGFAVVSHWVPFLLLSVWAGGVADKYDPRRVIQWGMYVFIFVAVTWGILIYTDTIEIWHAGILLILHGFAGVLWAPAAQLLIHDIVGKDQLHSGVRLMATSRTLGILLGPAIGGGLMLWLGPATAISINAIIYIPLVIWLWKAPYGPAFRKSKREPAAKTQGGFIEIITTYKSISGNKNIISMILLIGCVSFFVGNAYQAQMPQFTLNLVPRDNGFYYSILLIASGIGAMSAGIILETKNMLAPKTSSVFYLVFLWCLAIIAFAISENIYVSITILFIMGFFELTYNSMAQTIVQLNAPPEIRGRVVGLFNMSFLGLKTFSGVTTGFIGSAIGIHWALGLSSVLLVFFAVIISLFLIFNIKTQNNTG
ncbi:MAG: MFS transporter [Rhodospirillaceae bacterium]|nr:MFS transporter [Rhodospirillaceae bacterium]